MVGRRVKTWVVVTAVLCSIVTSGVVDVPTAQAATCLPRHPVAPVKPANAQSPSGFATKASTAIGQIGQRAPEAGKPSWDGDDRVNAMAQIGNTVFAAGEFDSYIWGGKTYARKNIVAFNATTGEPTSFAPKVEGGEILTIMPSCTGSMLFMGGTFTKVNGTTRNYAAKVKISDNKLQDWNPNPNKKVEYITMLNDKLVLTGTFTKIGSVTRVGWASVPQTTATATPTSWLSLALSGSDPAGPQKVHRVVANPAGTYAVAIGNFNKVGGVDHRRIVVLDIRGSTAKVMPWSTKLTASNNNSNKGTDCSASYATPELDVTWTPDGSRFVTVSTGAPHAGSICDSMAVWDGSVAALAKTSVKPLKIEYTGGDTLSAVACTNKSCVATGHHRWANNPPLQPLVPVAPQLCNPDVAPTSADNNGSKKYAGYNCKGKGAVSRVGIFEENMADNGALGKKYTVTPWNPTRSRQRSMHNAMMITPQGLWIGSDGDNFAGVARNDLVLVPFAK